MEAKSQMGWMLVTAIAPVTWGSVYVVTRHLLPPEVPLWGGVYRALPAGIVLLLIARRLPSGDWWWRAALLGVFNVGGFFALIYVAGTLLPSGIAATVMSTSAAALLLLGWAALGQRPRQLSVAGAFLGIVGVAVMVGASGDGVQPWGVVASLGAMLASSLGFVMTARWGRAVPAVTLASWQLVAGALLLLPAAALVEGPPPVPQGSAVWGFAYVSLVATALAYVAWFTCLQRLPAAAVGVVGLLNPVTSVGLGALIGGEALGLPQLLGITLVAGGILLGALVRRPEPAASSAARDGGARDTN